MEEDDIKGEVVLSSTGFTFFFWKSDVVKVEASFFISEIEVVMVKVGFTEKFENLR